MFHLDPPPGFQGLRSDLPIEFYERHLPHWRQHGATYFVTFRLADALPVKQQQLLREIRSDWECATPEPRSREQLEVLTKLIGINLEKWLDAGLGSCLLREFSNRKILERVVHFFDVSREETLGASGFDSSRYDLGTWVIMPNHVHLLVQPTKPEKWDLQKILQSWKRQSARKIHQAKGKTGSLWMEESFDRIVLIHSIFGGVYNTLEKIQRRPDWPKAILHVGFDPNGRR